MKRTISIVLSIGMAAISTLGCGSNSSDPAPGEEVIVSFGDGEATIYLRNVTVQQGETGNTTITAEVISDLPDVYTFQADLQSSGAFNAVLHNGIDISHAVRMDSQELAIEFMRPTWERSETLAFLDANAMNTWLQERISSGAASCEGLPLIFQDLPLQYVSKAILSYMATSRDVAFDLTKLQQVMCAQAADSDETNGLDYPKGLAGWEALRNGLYLPPKLSEELPTLEELAAAKSMEEKNNCARELKEANIVGTYATQVVGTTPTNLSVSCGDAYLDVDANCCIDEELIPNQFGNLRKATAAVHPFCTGVTGSAGATRYAEFRFAAHANICPSADNSCWGNGVRDTAAAFNCSFSGVGEAPASFASIIGGGSMQQSGVAGWNYMQFAVRACYAQGTSQDTIYMHQTSVDTNRPSNLICGWEDGQMINCYCAAGP